MTDEQRESTPVDPSGRDPGRISQVLSYRTLTLRVGRALCELCETGTITSSRLRALKEALASAR